MSRALPVSLRRVAAAALAATVCAVAPASASAATRDVILVGNAFGGTVSFIDGSTYANLGSLDIAPDRKAKLQALSTGLTTFLEFQVVKGQKGGENLMDDMALTLDGKTLIVSRGILRDVVAYDLATKRVKWSTNTGSANADHMAIAPDGQTIAVSASSIGYTLILDTATGRKIASLGAGDFPHGVDYSEDGKRIYIGSIGTTYLPYLLNGLKGSRQLTVIDATTYKAIRTYPQEFGVRPTVITRDQTKAYFQRSYNRGFVELDLASGATTGQFAAPGTASGNALFPDRLPANSMHHGLAINAAETKFCNAGTIDNQISIIDRATKQVQSTVSGFSKPYWAQNNRTGDHCLVSNSTGDYVSVISYATGQEVRRIAVGNYPQRERLGVIDTSVLRSLSPKVG